MDKPKIVGVQSKPKIVGSQPQQENLSPRQAVEVQAARDIAPVAGKIAEEPFQIGDDLKQKIGEDQKKRGSGWFGKIKSILKI